MAAKDKFGRIPNSACPVCGSAFYCSNYTRANTKSTPCCSHACSRAFRFGEVDVMSVLPGFRKCKTCLIIRPVSSFDDHYWKCKVRTCRMCRRSADAALKRKYRKDPKHKSRVRRAKMLRAYGLTPEQYAIMYGKQEGRCAICAAPGSAYHPGADETDRKHRTLRVDHDHGTGAVRGLLCNMCNLAIGRFKDEPRNLVSAHQYLEFHRGG